MYVRRIRSKGHYIYMLRESFRSGECWRHHDLFDLGDDPSEFIMYPGGNGFYFDPGIEEALQAHEVRYETEDLENAFLQFLDPHIRRIVQGFRSAREPRSSWASVSAEELLELQNALHSFDKRRLHFLRFGRIDTGELNGRAWKFFNVLLGKSRDEIEHTLEVMEAGLRPHEIRSYLYTSLDLQAFFPGHLMRHHPVALDAEKVDGFFLDALCSLNSDPRFWKGVDGGGRSNQLHPYLEKYLIMYFDHEFEPMGQWADYLNGFLGGRRSHPGVRSRQEMEAEEAFKMLGLTPEALDGMSRKELTRCYRQKAKTMHPDKGGDHEAFVRLTAAYECLLRGR